jgi:hypothetical protein
MSSKYFAHETAICRNPHNSSEIPALLDSWVKTHLLLKCVHKKHCLPLYFRKTITRLCVGLFRIGQVLRSVYRRVTTICCFMSDLHLDTVVLVSYSATEVAWNAKSPGATQVLT